MKIFRWKALVPLVLVLGILVALWLLFLDSVVRRNVEAYGTDLVGAKVDLAEADVDLTGGSVRLRGLQVTNPDAPMTNLFEVGEIVADLRVIPLLEKKIYIDTVAIREVRFGTARATSGAIDQPSETSRALRRQLDGWADRLHIPPFSLEGLSQTVNIAALSPESLQTVQLARGLVTTADSSRQQWTTAVNALNPGVVVDSGRAMLNRMSQLTVSLQNAPALLQSVRSAQTLVGQIDQTRAQVQALERSALDGVATLRAQVGRLDSARLRDMQYARGLLRLPSLDAPDLSPSIFGEFAVQKLQPLLYWLGMAERYAPPGLDPRRRPGPKRLRLAGEDVDFPKPGALPKFTVAYGELSLEIGGQGAAAGTYAGQLRGLSSSPAALGIPLTLNVSRSGGVTGPNTARLDALFDHTKRPLRDSVRLQLAGVTLPNIQIPGLNAQMNLGAGASELAVSKVGDSIAGRWLWRSPDVDWQRLASQGTGVGARILDFLWGVVSGVDAVDLEVRFSGSARGPGLGIRSNIGTAISQSLRRQLSTEIAAAESRLRQEIESRVAEPIAEVRGKVSSLQEEVVGRITQQRVALDQVKADLEARIAELRRGIGP